MRQKLIEKTIDISFAVDQDKLEFTNWDTLSNDQILEMYIDLRIVDYLQTHAEMLRKWYTDGKTT